MTTFNTGAYPPGCTQRDVDMAAPGYWDSSEPDECETKAPCPACGGDGGHETWGAFCSVAGDIMRGWQRCGWCGGTGETDTVPRELEDLEPLVPA